MLMYAHRNFARLSISLLGDGASLPKVSRPIFQHLPDPSLSPTSNPNTPPQTTFISPYGSLAVCYFRWPPLADHSQRLVQHAHRLFSTHGWDFQRCTRSSSSRDVNPQIYPAILKSLIAIASNCELWRKRHGCEVRHLEPLLCSPR